MFGYTFTHFNDLQLIKLFMTSKTNIVRVGVLNMTINFQSGHSIKHQSPYMKHSNAKSSTVASFIPRYASQRYKSFRLNKQEHPNLSPYQKYRYSQNQSIKYIREQQQAIKAKSHRIAGLSPRNNTIQLEVNQNPIDQDRLHLPNRQLKDAHLKMVYNKRHLRNTIDVYQQKGKNLDKLVINLKTNPEEGLKNIFTVRPVQTSQRIRHLTQKHQKVIKLEEPIINIKHSPATRLDLRPSKLPQDLLFQRKIRPWSTSRNNYNKDGMFDSSILEDPDVQSSRIL